MKNMPRFVIICLLIIFAAVSRWLPHPPNFSPVLAIALFSGAVLKHRIWSFIVPLVALVISDIVLGFHATIWAVYLSFAVIVGVGLWMKIYSQKGQLQIKNLTVGVVGSSTLFFIISNFGVWNECRSLSQNSFWLVAMLCYGFAIFSEHFSINGCFQCGPFWWIGCC